MGSRSKIPNLPDDIVNSILLVLPVKSLLRFKITCKSWCCSIDDPDFIKSHLHISSNDISRQKILLFDVVNNGKIPRDYSIKVLSTEASISNDSKAVPLDQPNISGFRSCHLQVFSCNGLVFIYHPKNSMILWNPAIRKYKRITVLQNKPGFVGAKFGFAYDVVAEDYKVLCIQQVENDYIVEIYSVKNQSWRTIPNIFPDPTDFPLYLFRSIVSLNGVIHIMPGTGNRAAEPGQYSVISFHLADEKFTAMPVPSKCGELLILHAYGDRVCVVGTVGQEILIWSPEKDGETGFLTWNNIRKFPALGSVVGMPQYSGNVILVMEYGNIGDLICVKEDGNILWKRNTGEFVEYSARKNEYTEFIAKEIPLSAKIGPLYAESLVSLKIPWD
ncbi:hypothetical protein HAX54_032305 [Datura stramonium]|uniref:F-box domain-containing protein n=1 Tax=Datura stramonium TaxID=4076 RepID=A0ABS8SCI6_DATST|nr:hypothetical protein [Datura stramonium]